MGRALECLWILGTLVWLGFAACLLFWGWPLGLSAFDTPPGSLLSQEAFVFSFVVTPPAVILVLGLVLEAALKLFSAQPDERRLC